jgi:hypothetical protein
LAALCLPCTLPAMKRSPRRCLTVVSTALLALATTLALPAVQAQTAAP